MKKISNFKSLISARKGFTLIELLIVIAVLGILAAVVLIAIDPVEQLARGRDSARKNVVIQIGRAVEVYNTAQGVYPGNGAIASWPTDMTTSGDIRTTPTSSTNIATICTATGGDAFNKAASSEICYKLNVAATPDRVLVFMKSESRTEGNKCTGGLPNAWIAYASQFGKGGTYCKSSEPATADANLFVE